MINMEVLQVGIRNQMNQDMGEQMWKMINMEMIFDLHQELDQILEQIEEQVFKKLLHLKI